MTALELPVSKPNVERLLTLRPSVEIQTFVCQRQTVSKPNVQTQTCQQKMRLILQN